MSDTYKNDSPALTARLSDFVDVEIDLSQYDIPNEMTVIYAPEGSDMLEGCRIVRRYTTPEVLRILRQHKTKVGVR